MIKRNAIVSIVFCAGFCTFVGAQAVTFNSPSEWMSLREQTVVAKTLLDTAKLAKKSVQFTLYKVEKGAKSRIGSSSQKAKEYSQEFTLAKLSGNMLGGMDYLKIEWSVTGGTDKGTLEPFGLAIIPEYSDTVARGKFIEGNVDLSAAGAALGSDKAAKAGNAVFAIIWNKTTLGIACKKEGLGGDITFAFDGKNGKNSFVAYADRFITYLAGADSVHARNYNRNVTEKGIEYPERAWQNEIKKSTDGQTILIAVPWHDTGIIPFNGRMIGFAAFAAASGNLPSEAQQWIPGTWANLVLEGGPKEPQR